MPSLSRAQTLGTACAAALALGFARTGVAAPSKIDGDDAKALATELALERAAVKAYTDAAAGKILTPPVLAVFNRFLADHTAHRDALVAALTAAGTTPTEDVAPLTVPDMKTEADVLEFVYTVERSLADGYVAAVSTFKNRDYAKIAASTLGVETTHVALIAEALRKSPAYPSGFVAS